MKWQDIKVGDVVQSLDLGRCIIALKRDDEQQRLYGIWIGGWRDSSSAFAYGWIDYSEKAYVDGAWELIRGAYDEAMG